jgi:hypothetical protein
VCAGTNLFFDAMWVIERKYLLFSGTYNSKSSPRYHIYDRTPPSSLPCSGVRPNLLESTASTPVSTSGRV